MTAHDKTTVLIVDDEDDIRDILAFDLKRQGHTILFADNGKDAFVEVEKHEPKIVISDIRMPGGGGLELLNRLRERDTRLPVVILTTGFADITVEEAIDAGAEALFFKPFDRKKVVECVNDLVLPLEERWAQKRDGTRVTTILKVDIQQGQKKNRSAILNMGRGGFFLALTEDFPKVGETVSFSFFIESTSQPIEGVGIVRWVRTETLDDLPAGCGVQFLELAASTRSLIVEYVNALKTHSFVPRK